MLETFANEQEADGGKMKVLIMEDEEQIRKGLARQIDWNAFGITEVYTAANGSWGVEIAMKKHPDIILADIRMPKMDGITAVKKLRTALPECSIIFISAYAEKIYFKEAIHLKAVSFVEKPINHEELKNVIQKAVEEQKQNKSRKETEKQVFYFNERQLVKCLTKNLFHSEEEMEETLAMAGIQKKSYSGFCSVIVLHCEKKEAEEEGAWNAYSAAVEEKVTDAPCFLLGMQKQEGVVVYCAFFKRTAEYLKLLEWIKEQLGNIHYYYILGGSLQTKLSGFQKSYNDAVLLKNKAFYSSYGSVLNCENESITFTLNTDEWKNKFIEYIKLEQFDELEKELECYKNRIMANQQIHYKLVCELYLYIYSELCKYAENRMLISGENGLGRYAEQLFFENENYEELHGKLIDFLQKLKCAPEEKEDVFVVRIKKYINNHYPDPMLSIQEIAEAIDRSVSHICMNFKKETNMTINQYITQTRIEAAKAMLDNPENAIQDVSEKCGYSDRSYFARAFKKYTGMTPTEYRGETL